MKKENLPIKEKRKIAKKLRKDFAKHVVPIAILIQNECEMDYWKNFSRSVTREALKEGISL